MGRKSGKFLALIDMDIIIIDIHLVAFISKIYKELANDRIACKSVVEPCPTLS